MSTRWDRAVRALRPLFAETDRHGHPLAYYCGGPERRCEHRTCDAVSLLAAADCLQEPDLAHVEPDAGGRHVTPIEPELDADAVDRVWQHTTAARAAEPMQRQVAIAAVLAAAPPADPCNFNPDGGGHQGGTGRDRDECRWCDADLRVPR